MQNNLCHIINQICTYIPSECYSTHKKQHSYKCFENQLPFYKEFCANMGKIISNCKFTYEFRFLTDPEWNLPPSPLMRFIACRCRDSWRYFWKEITTMMSKLGPFYPCNMASDLISGAWNKKILQSKNNYSFCIHTIWFKYTLYY